MWPLYTSVTEFFFSLNISHFYSVVFSTIFFWLPILCFESKEFMFTTTSVKTIQSLTIVIDKRKQLLGCQSPIMYILGWNYTHCTHVLWEKSFILLFMWHQYFDWICPTGPIQILVERFSVSRMQYFFYEREPLDLLKCEK